MKKIITVLLLTIYSLFSYADNKEGIKFEDGSWSEITAKAKKEKKLIFIDCYTSWCGPCKRLASEIFTLSDVGSFFNSHFVNYKVDMEKGEGVTLQKLFHVGAYPTLLWVDYKGNIIHRILGFTKAENLLSQAGAALKGGNFNTDLEKRYNDNKNNPEIVKEYLNALTSMSDSRVRAVTQHYLSLIPKEQYLDKDKFEMIASKVRDPFSSIITYIIDNRAEFNKKFTEERVTSVINANYEKFADSLVWKVKEGNKFDEALFNKLIALMEERNYEARSQVVEDTRIKVLEYNKEWQEYVNKIDSLIKKGFYKDPDSRTYQQWYKPLIDNNCKDKEVLSYALLWLEKSYEKNDSFSMSAYITYWESKIKILETMGDKTAELEKAKIELTLIKEFMIKQEVAYKEQTKKMMQMQSLMK